MNTEAGHQMELGWIEEHPARLPERLPERFREAGRGGRQGGITVREEE